MDKTLRDRFEYEWVINQTAKLLYRSYCDKRGYNWKGKSPDAWAVEYAQLVVDLFGYDDDVISSLDDPALGLIA